MAKRKHIDEIDAQDSIYAEIIKEFEGELLEDYGTTKYFIDTGSLAFNYLQSGKFIGGGIPAGKITEIYGPPAAAKSLIGTTILHGVQMLDGFAFLLDCERSANRDFAVAAGHIDPKRLVVFQPPTLERVFLKINNVVRAIREKCGPDVPIVFVYDSISASPTEREFRETGLPENYTQADWKRLVGNKEQPGERARVSSNALRKLVGFLNENNATLFIINQTRNKIGVMYGSPETTAGGGEALKFYASNRNRAQPQKTIENKKLGIPIGVNLRLQNKKCRSFHPFWATESVHLYFKNGINPISGLLSVLLQAERINVKSNGNYIVNSEYSDGREVLFKASKANNIIPLEVLLDCPKLVDAESKEVLEKYLSCFGDAIKLTNNEDVEETDFTDELTGEGDGEE